MRNRERESIPKNGRIFEHLAGVPAQALETPIAPKLKLSLENAYEPGKKVSLERFKGKIVLLRGVVPE